MNWFPALLLHARLDSLALGNELVLSDNAAHKQGRKTYEIVVYLACGTTGDYKPRNVGYCEVKSKQHAERKEVVAICAYFVVKQESEKDDNHSANAYHDCLSELFKSRFPINILISPLQIV